MVQLLNACWASLKNRVQIPRTYVNVEWLQSFTCNSNFRSRNKGSQRKLTSKTSHINELWSDWETMPQWWGGREIKDNSRHYLLTPTSVHTHTHVFTHMHTDREPCSAIIGQYTDRNVCWDSLSSKVVCFARENSFRKERHVAPYSSNNSLNPKPLTPSL